MDQAANLRSIVSKKQPTGPSKISSRVIAVTSGKGGVGKTNFTVNLALWLARQQQRVVIIDADFGLANIEVLLNVSGCRSAERQSLVPRKKNKEED